ncbi:MAG: TIGR02569 family protein [Nocardioidaceae bacterium]
MPVPSAGVLSAFGADPECLRRLVGGQGRAWYDGKLVLKPVDNPIEHDWVSDVFTGWTRHDQVHVPVPLRSRVGTWVHDGWAAHRYLAGRDATMSQDPTLIRGASEQFHRTIRRLSPPSFLAERTDPWSYGDRVAWEGAEPVGGKQTVDQIVRLRDAFSPIATPAQAIHGDLGGNVLVADDGLPAVIDWPPYFRPVGLALAIAVGDAVRWEGVPLTFVDAWVDINDWYQLLARALVYRLATAGFEQRAGRGRLRSDAHARASEPAVAGVLQRLAATA